jgi:hypothetical protein
MGSTSYSVTANILRAAKQRLVAEFVRLNYWMEIVAGILHHVPCPYTLQYFLTCTGFDWRAGWEKGPKSSSRPAEAPWGPKAHCQNRALDPIVHAFMQMGICIETFSSSLHPLIDHTTVSSNLGITTTLSDAKTLNRSRSSPTATTAP